MFNIALKVSINICCGFWDQHILVACVRKLLSAKSKAQKKQIFGTRVQHTKKKWTQSDLSFCKNKGSKN